MSLKFEMTDVITMMLDERSGVENQLPASWNVDSILPFRPREDSKCGRREKQGIGSVFAIFAAEVRMSFRVKEL